jgi:hypothetical protein
LEPFLHWAALLGGLDSVSFCDDEQLLGADVHPHHEHSGDKWPDSMSFRFPVVFHRLDGIGCSDVSFGPLETMEVAAGGLTRRCARPAAIWCISWTVR